MDEICKFDFNVVRTSCLPAPARIARLKINRSAVQETMYKLIKQFGNLFVSPAPTSTKIIFSPTSSNLNSQVHCINSTHFNFMRLARKSLKFNPSMGKRPEKLTIPNFDLQYKYMSIYRSLPTQKQ